MVGCIYTPRSKERNKSRLGTKTRFGITAASLSVIALLIRAQFAAAANVTLLGKILDMSCYTMYESDNSVYRKCARSSGPNRSSAGLLASNGVLYLLKFNSTGAVQRTQFRGSSLVRVTGKLIKRGGLTMLAVTALNKA